MNVADVYDYTNFENQVIKGAKITNTFISQPKEKYVESLFEELVTKTGFNSFEEWAIESQTTALIVIKKDTIIYCLLYTSPSPRDRTRSRMPSSA